QPTDCAQTGCTPLHQRPLDSRSSSRVPGTMPDFGHCESLPENLNVSLTQASSGISNTFCQIFTLKLAIIFEDLYTRRPNAHGVYQHPQPSTGNTSVPEWSREFGRVSSSEKSLVNTRQKPASWRMIALSA